MNSDITKISRLYENTYKEFIKYGNEEKDSFYLLNDILIMICLQIMYKEQNIKLSYKMAPRRSGDVPKMYADVEKAKKELGWTATKTLEDMCRDSWNFAQNMKEV